MGAVSGCCAARDRNDKVMNIETRNDKFFYLNYPQLLKEIDKRLVEADVVEKPISADINHLRFASNQLLLEIDYNRKNIEQETLQHYSKRLIVEVSNGEDFIQTSRGICKCLVRIEYQGQQKKTKKNLNCKNPKFYEIFKYPLKGNYIEDAFVIQVIIVEQKDVWKVIAQEKINLFEFNDQLVHLKFLSLPIFTKPVQVSSLSFKHRKEISEFTIDDQMDQKQNQIENHDIKQFPQNNLHTAEDKFMSPTSTSQRFITSETPASFSNAKFKNFSNLKADDTYSDLNEVSCIIKDQEIKYSEQSLRLNLRIQMITDAKSYLTHYMKEYQQRYQKIEKFMEKAGL